MLGALIEVFALGFGWLAVQRHETYRTNAEDLGFTDQSVWNWLRGQAFRFSLYEKAEFTTDIDLAALVRPDSFLAFHVEPMTVLLAPVYLVWPDVRALLLLQALGWALGALPAYRLARRRLDSRVAGLAFAAAYLLSPLGQWAVLSDLHTVLLAAPLLLWAADLLDTRHPVLFVLVGLLAASAKEEVGLAVAGLGFLGLWRERMRLAGLTALALGGGWSLICVAYIIPRYAGTAVSPFTARYVELGGSPGQALLNLFQAPHLYVEAVSRPEVLAYLSTLLLVGGWVGLLAPELLLPMAPSLALNVLSNSPWMASGRAHYSSVILPFVVLAAIGGCERLRRLAARAGGRMPSPQSSPGGRGGKPSLPIHAPVSGNQASPGHGSRGVGWLGPLLACAVLATTGVAYLRAGAGPLADGFAVPRRTAHHAAIERVLAQIPKDAKVTASSSLVPHLSQRTDIYLFPTLREAEYVALDVSATPFPTSAGDVFLRAMGMLGSGHWWLVDADDGVLLLYRWPQATQPLPSRFYDFARAAAERSPLPPNPGGFWNPPGLGGGGAADGSTASSISPDPPPLATYLDGALELVDAELRPSGESGPNGPIGTLSTRWRATRPIESKPRPRLTVALASGGEVEYSDFAALWWYPPERWRPGELIELAVPNLALRQVAGWWAQVPPPDEPQPAESLPPEPRGPAPQAPASDPDLLEVPLGELTVQVRRSSWRLAVLDPRRRPVWQESPLTAGDRRGPLGFRVANGAWWHLTEVVGVEERPDGASLTVATDDPSGRLVTIELTVVGPRAFRLAARFSHPEEVVAIGQAAPSPTDERLLGFGERFTAVNQRGRVVTTWAEDRRVAGYGDSTYAPLPFFISSRGYSLALETDVRTTFDLAVERPDRYAWEAESGELSLVFSYGPTPRDLVQQQVARSGLPPLPPIWAFGVWKTAIGGRDQVLADAARLRELDVPVSALYVYDATDTDSNIGWPFITFRGKRSGPYGDVRELNDALHAGGYKVLTYNTADFRLNQSSYAFPAEQGFFVKGGDGQPYVHPGFKLSWLDFTNPQAVNWWGLLWRRALTELGFDGGMLDLGELTPPDARYANGQDGRAMHNRYPYLYARAAFEAVQAYKPDAVLFVRSGARGAQAYQHLQWPGDPLIEWSDVTGLRSLLPAALSFGLSGFPYWHPEVGGYLASGLPRDSERELWLRWLQFGAFSPLLRDNYGDHQTEQEPVEMWSDDGTIEAFRFYARVHNRLVPYLYSYARTASESGLPLIRHLALSYPNDPRAWIEERQYLLGEELLVAPVLEEGARTRALYLPRGQWVDFWTGAIFEGGREITADAPLERIPVYVRAGALLPLAKPFDTLAPSADPTVQTWDGSLEIRAMPSQGPASSTFRLYDGTELSYRTDGVRSRFTARGAPGPRAVELYLPFATPPSTVLVDGVPTPNWRYDPEAGWVILELNAAEVEVEAR